MNIFTQSIEDEPELEYYNKMKLVENADGSWVDPSTIVAVRLFGDGSPVVVLDRCPPLHALTITCKNIEEAKAEMLHLAYAALGVQLDPE